MRIGEVGVLTVCRTCGSRCVAWGMMRDDPCSLTHTPHHAPRCSPALYRVKRRAMLARVTARRLVQRVRESEPPRSAAQRLRPVRVAVWHEAAEGHGLTERGAAAGALSLHLASQRGHGPTWHEDAAAGDGLMRRRAAAGRNALWRGAAAHEGSWMELLHTRCRHVVFNSARVDSGWPRTAGCAEKCLKLVSPANR